MDRVTFKVKHDELKGYLDKYNAVDGEISDLYDTHNVDFDNDERKKDREQVDVYLDGISNDLIKFERHVVTLEQQPAPKDNSDLVAALTQAQGASGAPGRQVISCQLFDGTKDKSDFSNWFNQFETMINSGRPMEGKYKLATLKNQ